MRVLVVHGSKRGGTAGLATMIGTAFTELGWSADVRPAAEVDRLGDVDAVVVGGALYMSRWHRDARSFVRRHSAGLRQMPVWLFSSGPLDDSARAGDIAPVGQVSSLSESIEAMGHMTFGGRLQTRPKGFAARQMAKKYAGDWRDLAQVRDWVQLIVHDPVFAEHPAVAPQGLVDVSGFVPQQRDPGEVRRA